MPQKVTAPAVSQLAGEIARKLFEDEWLVATEGGLPDVAKLIAAALLEREEKVGNIVKAANVAIDSQSRGRSYEADSSMDKLLAALSALGESK